MTTLASEHTADHADHAHGSLPSRSRYAFRFWRRGRPFWGSLFVMLGGLEIIWIPYSPIGVVLHEGIAGIGGMFIGALMIMFGVSSMFAPAYRVFAGIASILLSLVALPATNFGGFLLGTLCGLFGGAFVVAWAPRAGLVADTWLQRRAKRKHGAVEPEVAFMDYPEAAQSAPADPAQFTADGAGAPDTAPTPTSVDGFSAHEIAAAEYAAAATVPEPAPAATAEAPQTDFTQNEFPQSTTDPED